MYLRRLCVLLVVALLAAPGTGFAWSFADSEPRAAVAAAEPDAVPAVRSESPLAGRLPFADGELPVGLLGEARYLLAPVVMRADVRRVAAEPRRAARLRGATARGPPHGDRV